MRRIIGHIVGIEVLDRFLDSENVVGVGCLAFCSLDLGFSVVSQGCDSAERKTNLLIEVTLS